jgi:hypothetical protein
MDNLIATDENGSWWGAFIFTNRNEYKYLSDDIINKTSWGKNIWLSKNESRGIAIWDESIEKIELLWATNILLMLDRCKQNENWKTEGVQITRRVMHFSTPLPAKRNKGITEDEQTVSYKSQSDWVDEPIIQLTPEKSICLVNFLEGNRGVLDEMNVIEKKVVDDAYLSAYNILFDSWRKRESSEIDIASRLSHWQYDNENNQWSFKISGFIGKVKPALSNFLWYAYSYKPDQELSPGEYFTTLSEGLNFVENEFMNLPIQAEEEKLPLFEGIVKNGNTFVISPEYQDKLKPFWISPEIITPHSSTYQAYIFIESAPSRTRTCITSDGEELLGRDEFPTPRQLCKDINLDYDRVEIESYDFVGLYIIKSMTRYPQIEFAIEQAQKFWDQSLLVQRFKAEKIISANYGIQETETGYIEYFGICDRKNSDSTESMTREEYLKSSALRLTLAYALDPEGYKVVSGLTSKCISDEQILFQMHSKRSISKYIPDDIRVESKNWLQDHKRRR